MVLVIVFLDFLIGLGGFTDEFSAARYRVDFSWIVGIFQTVEKISTPLARSVLPASSPLPDSCGGMRADTVINLPVNRFAQPNETVIAGGRARKVSG